MNIQPVSVSAVTQAVERLLLADPNLKTVKVERGEVTNADPSRAPWIGIYRSDCQFPSRTLGYGPGMRGQRVGVVLLVQETDPQSGSACEDRLNALVDRVVSILLTDSTLGGAVLTVDEFNVRYPSYTRVNGALYLQTALIMFTAITTVGGN